MTLPVDPGRYLAFLAVMAVLAWTPGPANLLAVATGVERGKRAALSAVVGMNLATAIWYLAGALGLSAVFARFPTVLEVVALAGAAYLGWLAFGAFRAAAMGDGERRTPVRLGSNALRQGFAVQITNPKIVLMFAAILPPFVDPGRPTAPQMALFALATIGMDVISMSAYGLGGAALSARMTEPRFRRGFSLMVGLLLTIAAVLVLRGNLTCNSSLGRWLPSC